MYIFKQRRGGKKSFYGPNAHESSPFSLRRVTVSSFSRRSQPLFGKNKAHLHHKVVGFFFTPQVQPGNSRRALTGAFNATVFLFLHNCLKALRSSAVQLCFTNTEPRF